MSDGPVGAAAGASPSPVPTDEPTPNVNAATTAPTEESATSPTPVPAGAAGGGVSPAAADDKKAIFEAGRQVIAEFAKKAGLGELRSDGSHLGKSGDVVNAGKVLKELTALGKTNPKMKAAATEFLEKLVVTGKGQINWGFKLNGVPLNKVFEQRNAFKGVNAQPKSQPPADGAPQQTTSPGNASSGGPLNESAGATPPANGRPPAEGGTPSPGAMPADKVRAAVTPLMQEVAASDKSGDANLISRADIAAFDTTGKDPRLGQLLKLLDGALQQQVQKGGADSVSIDAATAFAAQLITASMSGPSQGNPNGSQPTQQQGAAR